MCLSVSLTAASSALVQDKRGIQKPMYYSSQAYRGVEPRYRCMDQLAFTLVVTTQQLRPHFQAHLVRVLTKTSLKKILQRPDALGCLTNWAVELSEFDIEYVPQNAVKRSMLVDFVVEFTGFPEEV